ncbi:AbrB family transcriptional regulator [Yoonia sp. SS1-5]|uniref:AbrB family transcriptional regulator n=1 Tax=Yoonia rhodophyticola TaxID=3137370 RepID=A0AAN0M9Q4_9RHOB
MGLGRHILMQRDAIRQIGVLAGLILAGALGAIVLALPIPLLTGPAIATTLGSLAGLRLNFPTGLRQTVFLAAGLAIGTTVTQDSISALARWPIAFAILAVAIVLLVILGARLMQILMRVDKRTALLAATPGHLSYVIALGEDMNMATSKIAVVQSIRLLALTLLVPFAARLSGIETGIGFEGGQRGIQNMSIPITLLCLAGALALTPLIAKLRIPAPPLLAGMIVGAGTQLTLGGGSLSHWIAWPALAAIGGLIGTRFAGIRPQDLRQSAMAGLAGTALAGCLTLAAAWLAKGIVDMPLLHVLVAFAPGGLETMTVMGSAIGANPGFVAAAHVGRLLLLSALIPFLVGRTEQPLPVQR